MSLRILLHKAGQEFLARRRDEYEKRVADEAAFNATITPVPVEVVDEPAAKRVFQEIGAYAEMHLSDIRWRTDYGDAPNEVELPLPATLFAGVNYATRSKVRELAEAQHVGLSLIESEYFLTWCVDV